MDMTHLDPALKVRKARAASAADERTPAPVSGGQEMLEGVNEKLGGRISARNHNARRLEQAGGV
jgi:hypothetical protein